jgi:hypothetical protein
MRAILATTALAAFLSTSSTAAPLRPDLSIPCDSCADWNAARDSDAAAG